MQTYMRPREVQLGRLGLELRRLEIPKDPAILKILRHSKFTMHSKLTMTQ